MGDGLMKRIPDWMIRLWIPLAGSGLWYGLAWLVHVVFGLSGIDSLLIVGGFFIVILYGFLGVWK